MREARIKWKNICKNLENTNEEHMTCTYLQKICHLQYILKAISLCSVWAIWKSFAIKNCYSMLQNIPECFVQCGKKVSASNYNDACKITRLKATVNEFRYQLFTLQILQSQRIAFQKLFTLFAINLLCKCYQIPFYHTC